jgi:hypothetical protein
MHTESMYMYMYMYMYNGDVHVLLEHRYHKTTKQACQSRDLASRFAWWLGCECKTHSTLCMLSSAHAYLCTRSYCSDQSKTFREHVCNHALHVMCLIGHDYQPHQLSHGMHYDCTCSKLAGTSHQVTNSHMKLDHMHNS